jgi:ribosomal protein S26
LYKDYNQTEFRQLFVVHDDFDDIAETALEDESAVILQSEKYKRPDTSYSVQFTSHKRIVQVNSKEYGKSKKEYRVKPFSGR